MKLKLLQLLNDNRRAGKPVGTKVVASTAGDETVIYLYDPIVSDRATAEYFGCVCAQDLVPEIDGITTDIIRLRINCPGGDVFAMQAIMNALRNQKAKLLGQVDGVAASAATGIAVICDELTMEPGSLFMIHNSHGLAYGNKTDLRALAGLMDKVDEGMVDAYEAKTGAAREKITSWMDAETWFTAEEAVAAGFANSVNANGRKVKACAGWNLSAFANAPAPEAEVITAPIATTPELAPKPEREPEQGFITADHRARQSQRLSLSRIQF